MMVQHIPSKKTDKSSVSIKAPLCCNPSLQVFVWSGCLVGGFNPFEKYARQIGSISPGGVKMKNWINFPRCIQGSNCLFL